MSPVHEHGPEYVVLLHGPESVWQQQGPEDRAAIYARHGEFAERCAAGGHTITGGAEVAGAARGLVVRPGAAGGPPVVTDGPYVPGDVQLGGYYTVRTHDVRALAELAAMLLDEGEAAEVRPLVEEDDDDAA